MLKKVFGFWVGLNKDFWDNVGAGKVPFGFDNDWPVCFVWEQYKHTL